MKFGELASIAPDVINLYWMDEKQERVITEIEPNQTAYLIVETLDKKENELVSVPVEMGNMNKKEILIGKIDSTGRACIKFIYQ